MGRHSRDDDKVPLNTLMTDGEGNLYVYNGDSWWKNGDRDVEPVWVSGDLRPALGSETQGKAPRGRWGRDK